MIRRLATLVPLLTLGACVWEEPLDGPQVLVPEDVEITWDDSFNRVDEGIGALIPVDLMVYDGATGEPLDGVAVDVRVDEPAALVVLPDEVLSVEAEECEDCPLFWDPWGDWWFEFAPGLEEVAGSAVQVRSDYDGMARVYVFVDAFEDGPGGLEPVPVLITTEVVEESFLLLPR